MEFYRSVFDGELTFSTFGKMDATVEESEKELVMHSLASASRTDRQSPDSALCIAKTEGRNRVAIVAP